jgi:hypothetical protein
VTQVINTPRPGRQSIHDELNTAEDLDQVKSVLKKMLGSIKFHEDDADATGQESLRLSSDAPIDGGVVVRNRTPVVPLTGNVAPPNTKLLNPVLGGMINHALDISPATGASLFPAGNQPEIVPVLRGFPNYQFNAITGHTTLDNPVYGNMIPQQEIAFQVKIGDKIKYGRIPLLDNHDEATPRPFLGVAAGTTRIQDWGALIPYNSGDRVRDGGLVYACIASNTNQEPPNPTYWLLQSSDYLAAESADAMNAIVQMHNDLVQSLITMGVFRMVPRGNDKIDWTLSGPG